MGSAHTHHTTRPRQVSSQFRGGLVELGLGWWYQVYPSILGLGVEDVVLIWVGMWVWEVACVVT